MEWFRGFAKSAEQMPNSSSRPLLSCLTKNEVYTLYKEEMGDNPTLSRVHFLYKMWKVNFPDVYIPKVGIIVEMAVTLTVTLTVL